MTPVPRSISSARTTRGDFRRPDSTMFGIGLAVLGFVAFVATAIGPVGDTGLDDDPPVPTGSGTVNAPGPDADGDEPPRAARPKPIPILDCRDLRLDLDADQREALATVGLSRCDLGVDGAKAIAEYLQLSGSLKQVRSASAHTRPSALTGRCVTHS